MKKTFIIFLTGALLMLCGCSSINLTMMPCHWLEYDKEKAFVMENKEELNNFIKGLETKLMEDNFASDDDKEACKTEMIKALGRFNSDFFEFKSLVVYNVKGAPELKYSVKRMSLLDGELSIVIKIKGPKYASNIKVKNYLLIPTKYIDEIRTTKITFS